MGSVDRRQGQAPEPLETEAHARSNLLRKERGKDMDRKRIPRKRHVKAFWNEGLARRAAQAIRRKEAASARMHNYLAEKHPEMELFSMTI